MDTIWRKLPVDIVWYMFHFLNISDAANINQKFREISRKKAIKRIGNFYYSRKLFYKEPPPRKLTLRVLKRYYIVKYEKEWLQDFPEQICRLLRIPFSENYCPEKYVRNFYHFCEKYNIDKRDLDYYGW